MVVRDEWEDKFQKWKKEKQKDLLESVEYLPKKAEERTTGIVREVRREERVIEKALTPRYFKLVKILIFALPILIFGYLIYANFVESQDFVYFYDIGSIEDSKKPYLTPIARVSEIINSTEEESDYRRILSGLVYFNAKIPRGSESVRVTAKFKDNLLKDATISIGARDQEEWHYKYNLIYKGETTGEWIVNSTEFNIADDELVLTNNQLSLLFNIPSLYNEKNQNNTIPIDWIQIEVHKPGMIEKWRNK